MKSHRSSLFIQPAVKAKGFVHVAGTEWRTLLITHSHGSARVWYGIVEFNVPLKMTQHSIGHFGDPRT